LCQGGAYIQRACARLDAVEERGLDPPQDSQPHPTRPNVKRQVKEFLAQLEAHARYRPDEAKVIAPIHATFRQRWPRLFACYAWPERYPTNTELETFFGWLRTPQRHIHGRKEAIRRKS
jgi:hypothetical protein